MHIQRWVAIGNDGEILAWGLTSHGRFERQCLKHSCQSYMEWVVGGARYCELLEPFPRSCTNQYFIENFQHGRIRKCQSAPEIL